MVAVEASKEVAVALEADVLLEDVLGSLLEDVLVVAAFSHHF